MVKIRASEKLKEFLVSREMPLKSVYTYKEIRPFLVKANPDLLQGCNFEWPKTKIMKPSPLIEKYREKQKLREYQQMTENLIKPQAEPLTEINQGIGMGLSFISVLFVGMLSGYYLGKYFLGLSDLGSLIISFIVCVIGIYVEVILYLLRSEPKRKKD